MTQRTALYGRFSSTRQNLSSADDQLRQCEERARINGWKIVHRFQDDAISGSDNDRPGYQGLVAAVNNNDVDLIVTESLSRLSRNQAEIAKFFDECQFHDVKIVTLQEGEITRMHIGMLGTMNAIYLDALGDATFRGVESRILEGKNGGGRAYGYRTQVDANGQPIKGELEINPEESAIILRILQEYADGRSPYKIVEDLNAEGIPSPRTKDKGTGIGDGKWKINAIHGNRKRGVGILHNELYIGKRIWNRQRMVRRPGTKQRISRLNPESEWKIIDVPHLRIVSDELWTKVRARVTALDAVTEAKRADDPNGLSGAHAARRPTYLLTGLVRCGCCGGTMNIAASQPKRYYCANSREKGKSVCAGIPGIPKDRLEQHVLNGIRTELMQPEAIKEFIKRYHDYLKSQDADRQNRIKSIKSSIAQADKELGNIMTAIKAGIFTKTTKTELESIEGRQERLEAELAAASQQAPTLPPDLSLIYGQMVDNLVSALNEPEERQQSIDAIRQLIDRVIVHWDAEHGHQIEIEGKLAQLLALAQYKNAAAFEAAAGSLKLDAGARFELTTFRL